MVPFPNPTHVSEEDFQCLSWIRRLLNRRGNKIPFHLLINHTITASNIFGRFLPGLLYERCKPGQHGLLKALLEVARQCSASDVGDLRRIMVPLHSPKCRTKTYPCIAKGNTVTCDHWTEVDFDSVAVDEDYYGRLMIGTEEIRSKKRS